MARDTQAQFSESTRLDEKSDLRDSGRSQALTADLMLGIGGAMAVTGLIMALTAKDSVESAWRFTPTADATGAAIWFGGSL